MASIVHREKEDIHLYVVSTKERKRDKIEKEYGDYWFTIHVKSLTEMDYKKALNRINNKIENKEKSLQRRILFILKLAR